MQPARLPLAAPTGAEPRDSIDQLLALETATPEARLRRRIVQIGAGMLALMYAASYTVSTVAPNIAQWQGQDKYETKDPETK
jgi:hypothetical protein